jgi:protein ImuA
MNAEQARIFANLQQDILHLQGFKPARGVRLDTGLGSMQGAFPNATFPVGAVHEFLSQGNEAGAATLGFVSALLSTLMERSGVALWISTCRKVFPPALRTFGIQPDKVIFLDLKKEREVVWAMEEGLKCAAVTAVIGEVSEIDFTASRRFQLAVEESQVTGFIHRPNAKKITSNAFVSRWRIEPLTSHVANDLPGIGFPKWKVELLKIRNGRPGQWNVIWEHGSFNCTREFDNKESFTLKTASIG